MEYRGLYVSATPDCEPNEGGYYCQVYADEDYGDQIDDFCIHPDELEENDDIKHWGKVMRWLQSHPDYTICDEYGTIETAEEFKQVLDWCGTYISSQLDCAQKFQSFNHKLNDKPKELWYSTVRNQEQISTERTQNYEDYFFRYLLYERMAGYLPV